MASSRFEAFASSNFDKLDFTEQAGRYAFQAEAERLILADVMSKLQLDPADTLLVVGCGPGTLLIPLSFVVAQATGRRFAASDRSPFKTIFGFKYTIDRRALPPRRPSGQFSKIIFGSSVCRRPERSARLHRGHCRPACARRQSANRRSAKYER
jgi:hypothetical protein